MGRSSPDLFRQSVYSRLAGSEDTNDAERLAEDPTSRMPASRKRREPRIAFTSTLHWFETEVLAEERNYEGLSQLDTDLLQPDAPRPLSRRVTLDIDSSESPVHGAQETRRTTAMYGPAPIRKRAVERWEDTVLQVCIRPLRGAL